MVQSTVFMMRGLRGLNDNVTDTGSLSMIPLSILLHIHNQMQKAEVITLFPVTKALYLLTYWLDNT